MTLVCPAVPGTEVAVDFRVQLKRTIISGSSALAAVLMLSAPAHAASRFVVPCDQVGRELKSLALPVNALTVDVVDHTPTDPNAIDEQSVITDSVAPVLYLTPRVANILRDVFGTTIEELPQELPDDRPAQPSSSPFADSDQKSDAVEPADTGNETSELPHFQKQMFRTDI
jgi:hypothetical protein